jgi:amino acid transporter
MAPSQDLARTIGPVGLAATVVNTIIGSSIFVFPAVVAAALGPAGLLSYLLAATAMALIVLCLADSGTRVTAAGGTYAYVEAAFGPFAAWLVGLLLYLGVQLIASAVVASVFVGSLSVLVPAVANGPVRLGVLVVIFASFALVNIRGGAKLGTRVVEAVTLAKLLPLLILVGVGLVAFNRDFFRIESMPPLPELGRMAMRLLYLFAGTEAVLALSGELRDPRRTVPRGALGGLALATFIYLGVQFAAQGILGPALPSHDKAPLADAAAAVLGSPGKTLILLGTVISTLGFLSADMLASPRTLFAMGTAGRLPRPFATAHPRFGSPAVAIAVHAAAACTLAIIADFDLLTSLASSALLLIYLLCCTATIVLQRRGVGDDQEAFRLPLGPLIPLAATALVVGMMTTLTRQEIVAVLVAVAIAGLIYLKTRKPSDTLAA